MQPLPKGGLVPFADAMAQVKYRQNDPQLGWIYTLHTRDPERGLIVHNRIAHADVLAGIAAYARYRVGDAALHTPTHALRVLERRWNFKKGTVLYRLSAGDPARSKWYTQEQVLQEVAAEVG